MTYKQMLVTLMMVCGQLVLVIALAWATQPMGVDPSSLTPRAASSSVANPTPAPAPVAPAPQPTIAAAPVPVPTPAPIQTASASAGPLTLVSWGGSYQDALREVFFAPFTAAGGVPIAEDNFNGTMQDVRDAIAAGKPWDVVEVEYSDMLRGCEDGTWLRLDWSRIQTRNDLIPSGVQDCGAGFIVWSLVLVYNPQIVPRAPVGWSDVWNISGLPGKRALRDTAQWNLEIALMADGVDTGQIYQVLNTPAGVDRAFAKLDQIKSSLEWWSQGVTPVEMAADGEVVMMSSYNGRPTNAIAEGMPLSIVWTNTIYTLDYWVIRSDSRNVNAAYDYINFSLRPEVLARFPEKMPFGPANLQAVARVPANLAPNLPTAPQNIRHALLTGADFWNKNGERLEQRFRQWRSS